MTKGIAQELPQGEIILSQIGKLLEGEKIEVLNFVRDILEPSSEKKIALSDFYEALIIKLKELDSKLDRNFLERLLPVDSNETHNSAYGADHILKDEYRIEDRMSEEEKQEIFSRIPKRLNYELFRGLGIIGPNDTPDRDTLTKIRDEAIEKILLELEK